MTQLRAIRNLVMSIQTNLRRKGFTIVELLIVIVVIGILAAITIVAYNGVQSKAQSSKITSDLLILDKAISAARVNEGKPLFNITGSGYTAGSCATAPSGTDLTDRTITIVNTCWVAYISFLDKVSTASGINVRGVTDPWGRPYRVDENENEVPANACARDLIATYFNPHQTGAFNNGRYIANSIASCP